MATQADAPDSQDDDETVDLAAWANLPDEDDESVEADGAPEAEADGPETDQPEAEADAGAPEDAKQEAAPEAEPGTSADAPAEPESKAEPAQPALLPDPFAFTFKADDREFTVPIPGARVWKMPDGTEVVSTPKQALNDAFRRHLAPYLADRQTWRNRTLELQKQVEKAKAGTDLNTEPVVVKANAALDLIGKLFSHDLSSAEGQDAVLNQMAKFKAELPVWEARQELAAEKQRREAVESAGGETQLEPEAWEVERQHERFSQALVTDLHEHVGRVLRDPRYAKLDQPTVDRVWTELVARPQDYFVEIADDDDPRFRKGEYAVLLDEVRKPLNRALDVIERVEKARKEALDSVKTQVETVAAVAKENATVLANAQPRPQPQPNGHAPKPKPRPKAERESGEQVYSRLMNAMADA